MTEPGDFSAEDKYRCAEREVELRVRVYTGLIRRGKMTAENADREVSIMRAIAMDYYRQTLKPEAGHG